jgi:hypothetical protein
MCPFAIAVNVESYLFVSILQLFAVTQRKTDGHKCAFQRVNVVAAFCPRRPVVSGNQRSLAVPFATFVSYTQ